jgi:hypothetical protein
MVWMWQAENYMIIMDGTSALPIFFDGTSARRSIGNDTGGSLTINSGDANYPANGGTFTIALASPPVVDWLPGTPISGVDIGEYVVTSGSGVNYVLTRISNRGPVGASAVTYPTYIYPELPAGRMGAYGMGRVWMSLPDGRQFMAGDIVGGPSGTQALQYRDAVLHSSENSFIAGGGYFAVPGTMGQITAMIFASTLDVSLGQGPLQVMTPTSCFSCYAPTDRTTWQTVTNPILTQSLIGKGSVSQWSTVNANGDIMFRATDGIRSLILARQAFDTWANVPSSHEMDRVLAQDDQSMIGFASSIVFDNRLIMTCNPKRKLNGGFGSGGLIALNFDPLSNIRGKLPAAYDGLWTGLNASQLIEGQFDGVDRAYAIAALTVNATNSVEIYEICPSPIDVFSSLPVFAEAQWPADDEIYDNSTVPIIWTGETSVLFKASKPGSQDFHRLIDGELQIDNLTDTVDFAVFYRPDQYPFWTEWFSWQECAKKDSSISSPQFRPRMGLGEPSSKPCDVSTKRTLREGYTFQFKIIIQGHCRVLALRVKAVTIPEPQFALPNCKPICSNTVVT